VKEAAGALKTTGKAAGRVSPTGASGADARSLGARSDASKRSQTIDPNNMHKSAMGGSKISGISKPSYEGQLVYEDPA